MMMPVRIAQTRTSATASESQIGLFRQVLSTLMFAVSSSRRENSLLALQAVQHVLDWAGQEARS
jgi:hypothetical protein